MTISPTARRRLLLLLRLRGPDWQRSGLPKEQEGEEGPEAAGLAGGGSQGTSPARRGHWRGQPLGVRQQQQPQAGRPTAEPPIERRVHLVPPAGRPAELPQAQPASRPAAPPHRRNGGTAEWALRCGRTARPASECWLRRSQPELLCLKERRQLWRRRQQQLPHACAPVATARTRESGRRTASIWLAGLRSGSRRRVG